MTATTRPVRAWLAVAACCLSVAGCSGGSPSDPRPTSGEAPTSAAPDGDATRLAVDDLASSLGVDASEVEVVAAEDVTWRDGSRGCAQPGEMYTQALVEGARITLRVDGTDYEYHSGGSRPPTLCEDPTE
jgi:hypothetical protein